MPDPDGTFRISIAGLGESANRIQLPALAGLRNVRLVSACDPNEGQRDSARARWSIPSVYADPGRMLEETSPDILVVAAPPHTHFDLCRQALESEVHVFCEKPFMPELRQADEIIQLAREMRLAIAVNNQYGRMPIFSAAQQAVASGRTGRPFQLDFWQHMHLPPEDESGWKAGLGSRRVLLEFGTHLVDLACRFFDALPEAVTARAAEVRPGLVSDLCTSVRFDFPEGRVCSITLNRMSHAWLKYLEMRLTGEEAALRASYGGAARVQLGWNGARRRPDFRFNLTRGGELWLERGGKSRKLASQPPEAIANAAREHFQRLIQQIQAGSQDFDRAVFSRNVLHATLSAYRSIESGGELVRLVY